MSRDGEKESVDLATQSLQVGVKKMLARAAKRREINDKHKLAAQRLILHTNHLLTQLLQRRKSLSSLITWFRSEWKRLEPHLSTNPQLILEHTMKCLIQCQDGLVLLTSGECRHPVDIQQSKSTKFKSRLATLQERGDGYTKLYGAKDYSGYGWDEFTNESVGIQFRLVQVLRHYCKDPWDYLERNEHTQLLEILLTQQENAMKQLHHDLQALKRDIQNGISEHLAKPTCFSTQDKMEKLEVTYKGQTIFVERRADNFQLKGTSVLPSSRSTPDDWKMFESLTLPTNTTSSENQGTTSKNKRRRMAIEESDSEDDIIVPAKKERPINSKAAQESGLVVKVKNRKSVKETEDSLDAIKSQMGVDVKELELAREGLEFEEHTRERMQSPHDIEVQRFRRVLSRAEQRSPVERDDHEIWDARECLRQAYMQAGNHSLWSTPPNFPYAKQSFLQAKQLVQQQQEVHERLVETTNDTTEDSKLIRRNLLYLLAQATLNLGITLTEARSAKSNATISNKNTAANELNSACEIAAEVAKLAASDGNHLPSGHLGKNITTQEQMTKFQARQDFLDASKLKSLALRWLGMLHWSSSSRESRESSIEAFKEAWSVFDSFRVDLYSNDQLLFTCLELAMEAFHSTCVLTEYASEALQHFNRAEREKNGKDMFELVNRALNRQMEIKRQVEALEARGSALAAVVKDFRLENSLPHSSETKGELEKIERWWTTLVKRPSLIPSRNGGETDHSRPEVGQLPAFPPTAHMIVSGAHRNSKRPSKPSSRYNRNEIHFGMASSNGNSLTSSLPNNADVQPPTKFRKWGDELLPPVSEDAEYAYAYPVAPPPIPEELKHLWGNQQSRLTS
eukprot:Nitzschia sp. Nitz4//scaffold13_size275219//205559//208114//NITZ4_000903-RA/size275219-processed-gene-0.105-mRNA-1//1//CDS//3329536101//9214//frame0